MPGRTDWMFRLAADSSNSHGGGEVGLGDDGNVRAVEYCRILQRLVFTLGDRKQNKPKVLAQIVGRGADQVADIFDEQKIQLAQVPAGEGVLDHGRFQMANRAGDDLFDGSQAAGKASCVVFRGQVADQGRDFVRAREEA